MTYIHCNHHIHVGGRESKIYGLFAHLNCYNISTSLNRFVLDSGRPVWDLRCLSQLKVENWWTDARCLSLPRAIGVGWRQATRPSPDKPGHTPPAQLEAVLYFVHQKHYRSFQKWHMFLKVSEHGMYHLHLKETLLILTDIDLFWCGLDTSRIGQGPVAGSCEHENKN